VLNVGSAVSRVYLGGTGTTALSDLARLRYLWRAGEPQLEIVQIETSAGCNYRCSFCPIGTMPLPKGRMELDLYEHILGQLGDFRGEIHPYLMNEPLLDKRIVEIVRLARERTPARVLLQTNGSRLTRDLAEELTRYATVIVNDYREDGAVLRRVSEYGVRKNLILVDRNPHAVLTNRAGNVQGRPLVHLDNFCVKPFTELAIAHDGRVVLCCQDWGFESVMGNVSDESIWDIWNSESFRRVRRRLLDKDRQGVCAKCDFPGV
jgi:radical SAM protein with 4Fe4S-binding SPASM domain